MLLHLVKCLQWIDIDHSTFDLLIDLEHLLRCLKSVDDNSEKLRFGSYINTGHEILRSTDQMVDQEHFVAMYLLLDTFLLDSLKGTKNMFNSFDLFDIARDPLLLDLYFMVKLIPLEDLSLDLHSDVALGLAGLFTCEQRLSDTCLSHLEVARVKC